MGVQIGLRGCAVSMLVLLISCPLIAADNDDTVKTLTASAQLSFGSNQPAASQQDDGNDDTPLSLDSVSNALNSLIVDDRNDRLNTLNTIDSVLQAVSSDQLDSQSDEDSASAAASPGFSVQDPIDPNFKAYQPPGSPIIIAVPVDSDDDSDESLPDAPVEPVPTVFRTWYPAKILPESGIMIKNDVGPPGYEVEVGNQATQEIPGSHIIIAAPKPTTAAPATSEAPALATTEAAAPATTRKPDPKPAHECDSCSYINGVGFVAHATDCSKFYRCEKLGSGGFRAHEFSCPSGLYWNDNILSCDFPSNTACTNKGGSDDGSTSKSSSQSSISSPSTKAPCDKRPVATNPGAFEQKVPGNRWVQMPCPATTAFDQNTCDCSRSVPAVPIQRQQQRVSRCRPQLHLSFNNGVRDESSNRYWIRNNGVRTRNGLGVFNGQSKLLVNGFANAPFGRTLNIRMVYLPSNRREEQGLLGNGDCCNIEPSVSIVTGNGFVTFTLRTSRPSRSRVLKVPITSASGPIDISMSLKNGVFTGTVNGQSQSGNLLGYIRVTKGSLVIGSSKNRNNFTGTIDDMKMSFCNN